MGCAFASRIVRLRARQAARSRIVLCALAASAMCLAGCRSRPGAAPEPGTEDAAVSSSFLSGTVRQYPVKAIVVSTDPAHGTVTADTEAIPGFMEAMIMPYKLEQTNIAGELHPGDHITAVLLVSESGSRLTQIVITQQAQPDYKPATFYNVPKPGEHVPDFHFINQNGRPIRLGQFHGKVVLLTFIYTRCPLPDYCVRMSRNFAEINRELARDPQLYGKTHLLTISFDPEYDTPAVLRSYGGAYTGKYTRETFAHWEFAAPPESELDSVEKFFNVGVTPGKEKTLDHSLSTIVIAPDGTIFSWYPTNDWKVADVLKDVKKALGSQA